MNNTALSPETIICRNEERFLSNSLGDELVMMDLQTGDYININPVGADLWNMLAEPLSINELLNRTVNIYQITAEQAELPVFDFVNRLHEQNLVLIHQPVEVTAKL